MRSLRISPNGRYFIDEAGAPAFWLGDTQWQLFRDFTAEDAATVLERRKAQGFSAVQIMITGEGDGTRPNVEGQTPWVGNDPARPNDAYFRGADAVVEAAGRLGVALVLGLYHKTQLKTLPIGKARAYARWIAARWPDAPHIIWTAYPEAHDQYIPILRELVAGVKEGEDQPHLITLHPDPSPASSSFLNGEDWLDFHMIQTWHDLHLNVPMVAADYARRPARPVVMAEGGYEEAPHTGAPWTPLNCRRQAWWSYLSGGHHSYGHHGNWTAPAAWRDWIDTPGARQMSVCRKVIESLPQWWRMVPDQGLFLTGEGAGAEQNVAARSPSGDRALVYLAGRCNVVLDSAVSSMPGHWVNPATGERVAVVPHGQGFRTPEGWEDAVLSLAAQ
jgi:hypothetical protein